jgi:hypothetical protein
MHRSAWTGVAAAVAIGALALAWRNGGPAGGSARVAAPAATGGSGKVALFDGKGLTGWVQYLPDGSDPAKTWSVKDGVIRCAGTPVGYLRTEKTFKNFFLVVEWRWPEKAGNSGVLIHMQKGDKVWPYSIEAQLESGNAGDFWLIEGATLEVDDTRRNPGAKTNVKHLAGVEKPLGEWNRYEITSIDGNVVLVVNGELVNFGRHAVPDEGHVLLQSEGTPIEFKTVEITPFP